MSTVSIISPADGSVVAERSTASWNEVESALDAARSATATWAAIGLGERSEIVLGMVDALLAMDDEIPEELARQMGRPIRFGPGELAGVDERSRHMISVAPEALADHRPAPIDGFERFIRRSPVGVVFVVAPWNYPYLTAVNTIVPALVAGNTVVLKHASQTLLAGERFAAAAEVAGLPQGVFTNLVLDHDTTGRILSGGLVDRVNFTGSVGGGRVIERAVAGTFAGVGLELGGKDPAYVRPDADLAHAAANILDGAMFNSGQSCCGIERLYAHSSVADEVCERLVAEAEALLLGDPLDPTTTLGPMVNVASADAVRDQVEAALAAGAARLGPGPSGLDRRGSTYHGPCLLTGVDHSMDVMTTETFGPVLAIMTVESDEEAIELMNDARYGLSASIWTSDLEAALAIGDRLETGTVFMNRADYLDPALAWTGVKETGRGVTLSALGYDHLTRLTSFHLRHHID